MLALLHFFFASTSATTMEDCKPASKAPSDEPQGQPVDCEIFLPCCENKQKVILEARISYHDFVNMIHVRAAQSIKGVTSPCHLHTRLHELFLYRKICNLPDSLTEAEQLLYKNGVDNDMVLHGEQDGKQFFLENEAEFKTLKTKVSKEVPEATLALTLQRRERTSKELICELEVLREIVRKKVSTLPVLTPVDWSTLLGERPQPSESGSPRSEPFNLHIGALVFALVGTQGGVYCGRITELRPDQVTLVCLDGESSVIEPEKIVALVSPSYSISKMDKIGRIERRQWIFE